MPTPLTHAAFSYAIGRVTPKRPSSTYLIVGAILSALPDLDVIAFRFGIPYEHPLGHRGITHSFAFAAVTATLCWYFLRHRDEKTGVLWTFLFLSAASHSVLDAFTNGGLGVAFFAPFSNARYFFPFRPIEVSPIGLSAFLTKRGASVLASEFAWVWVPTTVFVVFTRLVGRKLARL